MIPNTSFLLGQNENKVMIKPVKSWSCCELVRNIPVGIRIGHIFE